MAKKSKTQKSDSALFQFSLLGYNFSLFEGLPSKWLVKLHQSILCYDHQNNFIRWSKQIGQNKDEWNHIGLKRRLSGELVIYFGSSSLITYLGISKTNNNPVYAIRHNGEWYYVIGEKKEEKS